VPRARRPSLRAGIDAAVATTEARADWQAPLVGTRDEVQALPLIAVAPNVNQPRRVFPERAMRDLRESIARHGVLVPILVRPRPGPAGARYEIVAGERRWRASGDLGLATIPAVVRDDIDDRSAIELALVENLQRRNIDPMEEARALRTLLHLGYNQEELAHRLGKSPAHISERLRLTTLPESIQELVLEGRLSSSAARNIARIGDPARQQMVARELADGRYTIRQVEALMRRLSDAPAPPAGDGALELAQPGVPVDLGPLRERVAALLAQAATLPVGLDGATQTAVRAALQPLATLLAEWRVAAPGAGEAAAEDALEGTPDAPDAPDAPRRTPEEAGEPGAPDETTGAPPASVL
jgi:ParB family transcriptional regulator, chromosome partitioning protein